MGDGLENPLKPSPGVRHLFGQPKREPNDSISSPFEPIVEKAIGCLCSQWSGVLAAGLKLISTGKQRPARLVLQIQSMFMVHFKNTASSCMYHCCGGYHRNVFNIIKVIGRRLSGGINTRALWCLKGNQTLFISLELLI